MERKTCESLIRDRAIEIFRIISEYNKDSNYLDLCFLKNPDTNKLFLSFNNRYWEADKDLPLRYNSTIEQYRDVKTNVLYSHEEVFVNYLKQAYALYISYNIKTFDEYVNSQIAVVKLY